MEPFTISQLAQAGAVNVETVRYYERRRLLREPPRQGGAIVGVDLHEARSSPRCCELAKQGRQGTAGEALLRGMPRLRSPYARPLTSARCHLPLERSNVNIGLADLIDKGSVVHVEEARTYFAAKQAAGGQQGPTNYEELERARSSLPARSAGSRAVEHIARAGKGQVPVSVTSPASGGSRATYLDIHGGGFFMGSTARSDARNARLADALGVTVVSVEYRLAPENPWPAAPDDCETAALWLVEEGHTVFGTERMLIGGASAGATLATTTLLRLRDRDLVYPILGAVLQFGAYDLNGQSPGGRLYADEWFIQAYAGHVPDRTDPDVSPLYGDLRGLPPTLLIVGTLDVLLDDNLAMAARLSGAGNEVDLRVFLESMHGFTSHPTSMATAALDGAEAWLASRLE
jgi:acetyl esterase/lipase